MRFRFPSFSFSSGQPSINGAALEPVDSARAVVNDDGAILIDSEQGIMFSLNPTGGLTGIWRPRRAGRAGCRGISRYPRKEQAGAPRIEWKVAVSRQPAVQHHLSPRMHVSD
jgi:hypothetical protein